MNNESMNNALDKIYTIARDLLSNNYTQEETDKKIDDILAISRYKIDVVPKGDSDE